MKKNSHPPKSPRVLAVIFITLTFTSLARAEVNTREGSFKNTWYDSIAPGVDRVYNSRSHHRGVFGFRWCSSFDQILTKYPEFIPSEKCDQAAKLDLIKRLSADRFKVSLKKTTYLVSIDPKVFLVTEIETENGKKMVYRYSGDELSAVENGDGETQKFHYDLSRNLTEFKAADGRGLHLDYDLVYDRVIDVKYGDGCSDHFDYSQKSRGQNKRHDTTVTRTCRGAQRFSNTYEFTERKTPGENSFRLIKFRIFSPIGTQTEVSYE